MVALSHSLLYTALHLPQDVSRNVRWLIVARILSHVTEEDKQISEQEPISLSLVLEGDQTDSEVYALKAPEPLDQLILYDPSHLAFVGVAHPDFATNVLFGQEVIVR